MGARVDLVGIRNLLLRPLPEMEGRKSSCPECGENNRSDAAQCRHCLSPLVRPVRITRSRLVTQVRKPRAEPAYAELDALLASQEFLQFQCPVCARFVDGAASRCACGARFGDVTGPVGYECPLCRMRVASDAVECRCGARFSGFSD